jgi:PKD repeat protein
MKKILFLTIMAPAILFAQESTTNDGEVVIPCATYEMQEALLEKNPSLKENAEEARASLEKFTKGFKKSSVQKDGTPYIIPVVFHVIHNNGTENISDEQIQDCIRVLNEDFNAGNSELNFVNPNFAPIIGDVGVEFRLAQLDPDGNCTNGITRSTSSTTNNGGENLKVVSPSWGRDKYLNVWTCRTIASGAAGYAYNPFSVNGPDGEAMDGIVVRSDYVGAIGTSSVGRSHTMSHEVAHWINISHVWGGTNTPGLDSNCDIDDLVEDTPNSRGWSNCNLIGQSCGGLNNVENFMEYSGCGRMFTEGQANRMIASLNWFTAERDNLWQPENLALTGVDGPGILCKADFVTDRIPIICQGGSVGFTDISYNGITDYSWSFEGGTPSTSTDPNPVVVWNTPGKYSVSLEVSNAGGSLEVIKDELITVLEAGQFLPPLIEGFENYTSLDSEEHLYTVIPVEENEYTWELTEDASFTGSKSIFVLGRNNPDNVVANFITPSFDLSNVSETAVLTFKYAHARRISSSDDALRIYVSTNCGETWLPRRTIIGSNLPTVPNNITGQFIPESNDQWTEVVIDNITGSNLGPSVLFRFEFTSYRGNNIYLDDINMYDLQAVGLEEVSFLKELNVYPNPANAETTLAFYLDRSAAMNIDLLDITGRVAKPLFSGSMGAGQNVQTFDVSGVAQGIYLIRILADGEQVMKRIAVNK